MRRLVSCLVTLVLSCPNVVLSESPVRLLQTGSFLIEPPKLLPNEEWFGLQQIGNEFTLIRVKPGVAPETPICGSHGTRISVAGSGDYLFLVSGVTKLTEGPIRTTVSEARFLYPGEQVFVTIRPPEGHTIEALGRATREVGGVIFKEYSLLISSPQHLQVLESFKRISMDNPPKLVWSGDLDRDSSPDLLFNFPLGDVGDNYVLFLSSAASGRKLVSRVASFSTPGC